MRITTRVALGLFLMAGLLIATLLHQHVQVERLQAINRDLSRTTVEAARISVRLLQGFEGVWEFAAKGALLADADYQTRLEEWEEAVSDDLRLLREIGLAEREEQVRTRMANLWEDYRAIGFSVSENPLPYLDQVEAVLTSLRAEAETLIEVNQERVGERAATATVAADRARRAASGAAALALVVAGVLSLLLYLSVSGPIRRLIQGTREVAEGRFDHRLAVEGPGELQSLAGDFNRMAEKLGELEGIKQEFVSHVSHELKTPLAAIQETIEIFLDEIPGPLTTKQAHLLELSKKSSVRLGSMISNLLEVSRLEGGDGVYDPRWSDLAEIAVAVVEEMQALAHDRGLRLEVRTEPEGAPVACDRERIRDVVGNLVGNAIKFSERRSTVAVTVAEAETVPSQVPSRARRLMRGEGAPFLLLTVEDGGPGVPDEHKERIFEKFHQVTQEGRIRGQGVGLGLAIARRVVEAHRGTIWVADRPGGGAAFHVLLPRVPSSWADRIARNPPPRMRKAQKQVGERTRGAGTPPSLLVLGLAALLLVPAGSALSGCSLPGSSERTAPEPPGNGNDHSVASASTEGSSLPEIPLSAPEALALERAWSLLGEGSYEGAVRHFDIVLDGRASREGMAEALWGLALVHILPESPRRDPDQARALVVVIEEEFPGTPWQVQARWARNVLDELDRVQAVAEEQEEMLRQLAETVELLKRIDLNRRPGRGPRPDSPPREPPLR